MNLLFVFLARNFIGGIVLWWLVTGAVAYAVGAAPDRVLLFEAALLALWIY
jgi:hypothetical protein